jgi:predicted tellurium resistance membrane protein TerC
MVRWFCLRYRQTVRYLGLLTAVIAPAGRVALGAIMPAEIAPRMQLAALIAASVIWPLAR